MNTAPLQHEDDHSRCVSLSCRNHASATMQQVLQFVSHIFDTGATAVQGCRCCGAGAGVAELRECSGNTCATVETLLHKA